jgi:hypothetical protein
VGNKNGLSALLASCHHALHKLIFHLELPAIIPEKWFTAT